MHMARANDRDVNHYTECTGSRSSKTKENCRRAKVFSMVITVKDVIGDFEAAHSFCPIHRTRQFWRGHCRGAQPPRLPGVPKHPQRGLGPVPPERGRRAGGPVLQHALLKLPPDESQGAHDYGSAQPPFWPRERRPSPKTLVFPTALGGQRRTSPSDSPRDGDRQAERVPIHKNRRRVRRRLGRRTARCCCVLHGLQCLVRFHRSVDSASKREQGHAVQIYLPSTPRQAYAGCDWLLSAQRGAHAHVGDSGALERAGVHGKVQASLRARHDGRHQQETGWDGGKVLRLQEAYHRGTLEL